MTWRGKLESDENKKYPDYHVNPVKDKNTLDSLYSSASWVTCIDAIKLFVITMFLNKNFDIHEKRGLGSDGLL